MILDHIIQLFQLVASYEMKTAKRWQAEVNNSEKNQKQKTKHLLEKKKKLNTCFVSNCKTLEELFWEGRMT